MLIHGERIRQARKLCRFTQKTLAAQVGVKQNTLSQFEAGLAQPSSEVASAISFATGFPVSFFTEVPGPEVPLGSLVFRARASVTKADLEEAHVWAELLYECALGLATRLRIRPAVLPNLSTEPPVRAAQIARSAIGLGPNRPIVNLLHVLEQQGVLILALPSPLPRRDAFSAWAGTNPRFPIIILPTGSLGGRQRFTIAHELDHLLTPDYRGYPRLAEDAADHFASEFLMPEAVIASELRAPITLNNLEPLAVRWGVSVQALVTRAWQLEKISQRRSQQLFQQLSSLGLSRKESTRATIPVEKPRAFRKMAESIYGIPVHPQKLASDFHLPLALATGILAAHAEKAELVPTVPQTDPGNLVQFVSRTS